VLGFENYDGHRDATFRRGETTFGKVNGKFPLKAVTIPFTDWLRKAKKLPLDRCDISNWSSEFRSNHSLYIIIKRANVRVARHEDDSITVTASITMNACNSRAKIK